MGGPRRASSPACRWAAIAATPSACRRPSITRWAEILRLAFDRALGLLAHNRRQLLQLAALLREKEVLEGSELRGVLEGAEAPERLRDTDERSWAVTEH